MDYFADFFGYYLYILFAIYLKFLFNLDPYLAIRSVDVFSTYSIFFKLLLFCLFCKKIDDNVYAHLFYKKISDVMEAGSTNDNLQIMLFHEVNQIIYKICGRTDIHLFLKYIFMISKMKDLIQHEIISNWIKLNRLLSHKLIILFNKLRCVRGSASSQ